MSEIMTVAELLNKLGAVKARANDLYKGYKELKNTEDVLKQELMLRLKDSGLKSAKGETFTASIAETPRVVVTDEAELLKWLQETPDVESDFYIGVKKPEFNTLAKQMLKETGELANGTQLEVTESLSIRANKKG